MDKFRYRGTARIDKLATRKEGDGADVDKELAVDLKLSLAGPGEKLCGYFDEQLADFLFLPGNRAVRNKHVQPIAFDYELHEYRVDAVGTSFYGASIKKIAVQPIDGGAALLTLQVSFKPSANEVALLAEHLMQDVDIVLEPETEELPLGPGGTVTINVQADGKRTARRARAAAEVV